MGATFTMRLKDVVEATDGDIGLGSYPIFDDAYRAQLNQKIVDHYWNQEIGVESIDMFRMFMRVRMNEIMPMYNKFYEAQAKIIDPFITFKSSSTSQAQGDSTTNVENESVNSGTTTSKSDGETTSTSEGVSRAVASEMPQVKLSPNKDYATSAQDSHSESGAKGTATEEGVTSQRGEGTATTAQTGRDSSTSSSEQSGFSGSMASLLVEYRESFMNIDVMIINELQNLFMLIVSNGDSFTGSTDYYYPFGG